MPGGVVALPTAALGLTLANVAMVGAVAAMQYCRERSFQSLRVAEDG